MAIIRNNTQQFTIIAQSIMRDDRLSLKDIGLLVRLLSLPDNWEFSENGLTQIFQQDGQTSIRTALKKLEECGYLVRKRNRDSMGRMTNVEWTIYDHPHFENPNCDFPNLDYRPQSNTKVSNTKESNTNSKKESKVGKKNEKSFDTLIGEYTQDEGLKETLGEFIKMRQRIRKPMTNYALTLMLKKLDKLGSTPKEKIDLLNQSIVNSWQDVYPLKQNGQKKSDQWDDRYYKPYEGEEPMSSFNF